MARIGQSMHVLAISSRPSVLRWIRSAAHGAAAVDVHHARWVEDGNGVLRARGDFDLVMIDLDAAGLGAADVSRVWSVRPGTNIAVLRWMTSETDLVECIKAGALGYFPKELSTPALAAAMQLVAQGVLWCPNLRRGVAPGGARY